MHKNPIASVKQQIDQLPSDWRALLNPFIQSPAYAHLCAFIDAEQTAGKTIYPHEFFRALHLTTVKQVKVIILGQDPYHGDDHGTPQAHGLAFSVPTGVRPPPSLRNIFKELAQSLQQPLFLKPPHGCLDHWAQQGVLLLNAVLSVQANQAASHAKQGWEQCTDTLLTGLMQQANPTTRFVFMLWGAYAQSKRPLLDETRCLVLTAPHPSPLSAHRGFLGCGHFVQTNQALQAAGLAPIDWCLPTG